MSSQFTASARLESPDHETSRQLGEILAIKLLGHVDYTECYAAMRAFTVTRDRATPDELWIVEHEPIYTAGIAGRTEHFPRDGSIPVVRIDRGGQITYHGPGQAIVYCLIDLARGHITVGRMVNLMEQAVIDVLSLHGLRGTRRFGAPGVYIDGAKIAALGLRVRSGRCYHGVALNVSNDLAPFSVIDPCGYPGLPVTRTADWGIKHGPQVLGMQLAQHIAHGIHAAGGADS